MRFEILLALSRHGQNRPILDPSVDDDLPNCSIVANNVSVAIVRIGYDSPGI